MNRTASYRPGYVLATTLAVGFVTACSEQMPVQNFDVEPGVTRELAHHRASIISDLNYELRFKVPAEIGAPVPANVTIRFELADADVPLVLDFREGSDLINTVAVNGAESSYQHQDEHIVIPAEELSRGKNEIQIDFLAGETSLNRNPEYLYTILVPDRARTVFPVFDQPDLKATYDLSLEIPADWRALSAAPVKGVVVQGNTQIIDFQTSDPMSTYHFSFVAGKFEEVSRRKGGRTITMLHREPDEERVARNIDAIFDLHFSAIDWMEDYTGIDYPFQKFAFAAIPTFQFGGMEHIGAILYRASTLFLDEAPPETRQLDRANLIAHETSHMWFGNLVTMEWFNDVWTKEVFANVMATKITEPDFPGINHGLKSLVRLYPRAYGVDRTEGANPIRQDLPNLNQAGQLYGAIIYAKAPVMMRQLEAVLGEDSFRQGLQEYLQIFSFGNASWPALIKLLDARTNVNLPEWSNTWVSTAGRPEFRAEIEDSNGEIKTFELLQDDPAGQGRIWPQRFTMSTSHRGDRRALDVVTENSRTPIPGLEGVAEDEPILINADGYGYGLFPSTIQVFAIWDWLSDVEKASALINLYENMLDGIHPAPRDYIDALLAVVSTENDQQLLSLELGYLRSIYWGFVTEPERRVLAPELERTLWNSLRARTESSEKKLLFETWSSIALSGEGLETLHDIWSGGLVVEGLKLSDDDIIMMAELLSVKLPSSAEDIITTQLGAIDNPDKLRRFEFVAPSLSADPEIRDSFVASLAAAENREIESWVGDALSNIHHPLRVATSEKYILSSLELLEEIQFTGDIFFPSLWLSATMSNHRSSAAESIVRQFLESHPDYNPQLRMKVLQAADTLFRKNQILNQ